MNRIRRVLRLFFADRWLVGLLLLAMLVRLVGTTWGFPYIYHPDEPTVVRDALGVSQFHLKLEHFDWPHLQTRISAATFWLFIKGRSLLRSVGLEPATTNLWPLMWDDTLIFYFLGRLWSVLMGSLTVAVVYLIGKNLHSRGVGALAALLLLFNTEHIANSRIVTIDAPMVFWLTLSLYFALNALKGNRGKEYLLAGVAAGLATSTKYNGAFSVITIINVAFLSVLVYKRNVWEQMQRLFLSGGMSLFGFFLGTPNVISEYKNFLRADSPMGAIWQFTRPGNSGDLTYLGKVQERWVLLREAMGTLPFVMSLSAMGRMFIRPAWPYVFLGVFPLFYFLYVAGFGYFQAHFFLPLYPYLSLLAALFLVDLGGGIRGVWGLGGHKGRYLFIGVAALVLSQPILNSWRQMRIIENPDTRTLAVNWVNENLPDGATISLGSDYEPIFEEREGPKGIDARPDRYYLVDLSDLEEKDQYDEDFSRRLQSEGVEYVILGGFGLGEDYDRVIWSETARTRLGWLKENATLIKRFDPIESPGPTVLVFSIAKKGDSETSSPGLPAGRE